LGISEPFHHLVVIKWVRRKFVEKRVVEFCGVVVCVDGVVVICVGGGGGAGTTTVWCALCVICYVR
jgi:Flp pilus assembly CpaF family ATPase